MSSGLRGREGRRVREREGGKILSESVDWICCSAKVFRQERIGRRERGRE